MKIAVKDAVAATDIIYPCGHCNMLYKDYKTLVQHLFWRHGTESQYCNKCCLKRWRYAAHICNVLPIEDQQYEEDDDETTCTQEAPVCTQEAPEDKQEHRESEFCICGKYIYDSKMIGCDAKECHYQWFHYTCVGIQEPPDGDWFCPICTKLETTKLTQNSKGTEMCLSF